MEFKALTLPRKHTLFTRRLQCFMMPMVPTFTLQAGSPFLHGTESSCYFASRTIW